MGIQIENQIYNKDCLVFMQEDLEESSVNLLFSDPPYNLGSQYTIDKEGHYRFKGSGSDFMSKWVAMDGLWWDKWFKEVYRVVKPGGFVVLHNIDRQSDLWSYYARRNGFYPMQKLYWLFLDNFAKGTDVGLMIDKKLGVERTIIGRQKGAQAVSTGRYGAWGKKENKDQGMVHQTYLKGKMSEYDKTVATSDVAKKYDGYKYNVAPLKQTLEEILVFWKQPDNNVPTEILNFERALKDRRPTRIHPSIMNIKDTRVQAQRGNAERWTPQLIVDTRVMGIMLEKFGHEDSYRVSETVVQLPFDDYEDGNWNYIKKATVDEKEWGLNNFEPKGYDPDKSKRKNNHPSPKPQALCNWILKLFMLPNPEEMVIFDPFSGCFDKKTEVLTTNGWMFFNHLEGDELFFSKNKTTDEIEYVESFRNIKYHYKGKMYSIQGRSIDQIVTPNHKVFAKEYHQDQYTLQGINKLKYSQFHFSSDGINISKEVDNEYWLQFIGFWLADGYRIQDRNNLIGFKFKKDRKINYIESLLHNLNFRYKNYPGEQGRYEILNEPKCLLLQGNVYTKRVPKYIFNLSIKSIEYFLQGFFEGDGSAKTYYSVNEGLIDDLQILLLLTGRGSNKTSRYNGYSNENLQYELSYRQKYKNMKLKQKNISLIDYDDFVFDVTLYKNHTLYVRRNGKCCWSGNSGAIPLAAKRLGMQWIGTELDPEYFKLAEAKLTYKPNEEQTNLF